MIEKKQNSFAEQKAVLCGLVYKEQTEDLVNEYLVELQFLAETAGANTYKKFIQKLFYPDSKTFMGKGKLEEIQKYCAANKIDIVIFDDELSGSQIGNIIEALGGIRVIDRSDLILDIFASRAKTAQAKAQVELAQYQYILPRLRGMWKHLERQGAGIGSRGPGETEIETDRRIVRDKISQLRTKLKEIDKQATTQRKERGEFIRVSLVGYTNVGKSTIMNLLSKSDVLAENKLFATLDTTTRKLVFERTPFLLSDTVGFIRKLPHHLVESFKSTLDEVREADILLHVVDINHLHYEDQMAVVNSTLLDLKCEEKNTIVIFNKMDLFEKNYFDAWLAEDVKNELRNELRKRWMNETHGQCIFVSATEKQNIENLRTIILDKVKELYGIRYPYKTIFYE
ncbi:MAG: GTPase HflX [Chitinophagaceae bacterium]|nr:GTPase HflX [Chitinophagaceae bacterium]